jgi:hypothetical protein
MLISRARICEIGTIIRLEHAVDESGTSKNKAEFEKSLKKGRDERFDLWTMVNVLQTLQRRSRARFCKTEKFRATVRAEERHGDA